MASFRLGRHNKQLIYWQASSEPSDNDPLVVVCFKQSTAKFVVQAMNNGFVSSRDERIDIFEERTI